MLRGSRAFSGKIHQPFLAQEVPPFTSRVSGGDTWRCKVGTTKDQGLYNKPSAAVHPRALAAGTLPQYNTSHIVNGKRSVVHGGQNDPAHVLGKVHELQWDSHKLTCRTADDTGSLRVLEMCGRSCMSPKYFYIWDCPTCSTEQYPSCTGGQGIFRCVTIVFA